MALNHPVGGLLLPELSGVGKGQTFGEGERRIGNRHIWQAGVWHYSGSSHFPSQRGGGAPRLPWGRGKGSQTETEAQNQTEKDQGKERIRPYSSVSASVCAGGGLAHCPERTLLARALCRPGHQSSIPSAK